MTEGYAPPSDFLRACINEEVPLIGSQWLRWVSIKGNGPGAIVLTAPGPGQLHLGISTGAGIIHADCAARRVVDRPAPLPWPILAAWTRKD